MNSFDPTLVRLVINLIGAVSARRRCGAQDCQRHLAPDLRRRIFENFDLRQCRAKTSCPWCACG